MIKISTPSSIPIPAETVQNDSISEDLSEDETSFFTSIRGNLNKIEEHPHPDTVNAILKYSKSL